MIQKVGEDADFVHSTWLKWIALELAEVHSHTGFT